MMDLKSINRKDIISAVNLANLLGVSRSTMQKWEASKKFIPHIDLEGNKFFYIDELIEVPEILEMKNSKWDEELGVKPLRNYSSVELFAGAGGLALGMEMAGFNHVLLNEFNKDACLTLKKNRPNWNVVYGDISNIDFSFLRDKIDFISGGFPCQAFSYAGKQEGFNDIRGTMFFQLARVIEEVRPKVFLGENVKGLVSHDEGRTFATIKRVIEDLGYHLVEPQVLKAIKYSVPQKRERIFLVAIRNDYVDKVKFEWPHPYHRILTLRDAFYSGELYKSDVPTAPYSKYPIKKAEVMKLVPQGGCWRDLPLEIQKEYLGGSFLLEGGKTGMARRLSLDEPSLTLTCAPAQKQTERCHPLETRPLTIREYARIQTFPDDWAFCGSISSQYKQIGNAVPVNLAWAMGRSLIRLLNDIEKLDNNADEANRIYKMDTYIQGMNLKYSEQLSLFEPTPIYISK